MLFLSFWFHTCDIVYVKMNVLSIVLGKFCKKIFCGAFSLKKAADKGFAAGEHMFFRYAGFPQPAVCISAARLCFGAERKGNPAASRKKANADFDLAGKHFPQGKRRAQAKPSAAGFFCFAQTKSGGQRVRRRGLVIIRPSNTAPPDRRRAG